MFLDYRKYTSGGLGSRRLLKDIGKQKPNYDWCSSSLSKSVKIWLAGKITDEREVIIGGLLWFALSYDNYREKHRRLELDIPFWFSVLSFLPCVIHPN